MRANRLNDLDAKSWLKFQKSWFVHNPPARRKEVLAHPAKFPETLAQAFIEFFTKKGEIVLDPMAGTGSTLIAALRSGRNSYGIELNQRYVKLGKRLIGQERKLLGGPGRGLVAELLPGDAADIDASALPVFAYVLTSPPYWDMLHAKGARTQSTRRKSQHLDVVYSDDERDLGNIHDYRLFLDRLVSVYAGLKGVLRHNAYLTIIVKNVKKGGRLYPLAWDLARELGGIYTLKDEKLWCQDNQPLAPYGLGSAWVSNTFHHYCLQFRYET
jgi:DNA modification methylase